MTLNHQTATKTVEQLNEAKLVFNYNLCHRTCHGDLMSSEIYFY